MLLEEQRNLHEEIERLEQAIADRLGDEPKQIRDRLNRETEIAQLLDEIATHSTQLLEIYADEDGSRAREIQEIGNGESEFYTQLGRLREYHSKYQNRQAESSEARYRMRQAGEDGNPYMVDSIFSGEEAYGRFFDLNPCFESFLNLPEVKRLTYLQYLEVFDNFSFGNGGLRRSDKLQDSYFQYLGQLNEYLESFMRRTRPLESIEKVLAAFDVDFEATWEKDEMKGWEAKSVASGSAAMENYCTSCEKRFANEAVYAAHLKGKKHIRAAEKQEVKLSDGSSTTAHRLKERAIAGREHRIQRLAAAMSTERSDTRVNVERRQGMTERERQQELETILNPGGNEQERQQAQDEDDDDGDKFNNPLKLPLAWDGKPIPFWLYRLHGLGEEFPCEICGNYVYRGRRAFEKHFNEPHHTYGLKCLGISSGSLFRDITKIDEAMSLWDKIQKERKRSKVDENSVVQMEDGEGNVMPEKVYYDLQKQGLL